MRTTQLFLILALAMLLSLMVPGCKSSDSADSGMTSLSPAAGAVSPAHDDDDDDDDDDDFDDDDDEEVIPLGDVPDHVRDAAQRAMPGIVFHEAEREVERGVLVYELVGIVNGTVYEIEVTADGQVIEVELDDD